MNLIHPAPLPEPRLGVRKRATEDNDRIVDAAWGPMKHFLGHERPAVDLLGDSWRNRAASLVGDVYVTRIAVCRQTAALGEGWELYAAMQEQKRRRDAS